MKNVLKEEWAIGLTLFSSSHASFFFVLFVSFVVPPFWPPVPDFPPLACRR
ncbi:MAG: hypothetical protein WD151_07275 [Phycisphaeraceae bacterium]